MSYKFAQDNPKSLSVLKGLSIVDSHFHMGEDRDGTVIKEIELLHLMDENYIEQGLVFPFNEKKSGNNFLEPNCRNLEVQKRYPDRFMCGFRLNPKTDYSRLIKMAVSEGVSVLKLHPSAQHFKIASASMRKLLGDCLQLNYRPVIYIHTDIIPVEGTSCQRLNCPKDVITLAREFSQFNLVIAHCGHWCKATEKDIIEVNNVYIDTSIAPLFLLRKSLAIVGYKRMIFGSDFPYSHPRIEMQKIALLGETSQGLKDILGANIIKVLGL